VNYKQRKTQIIPKKNTFLCLFGYFVVNKRKMRFDDSLLDRLTVQAKASPRLRMNLDLRNTPADQSQRILNALEPATLMPSIAIATHPRPWWY